MAWRTVFSKSLLSSFDDFLGPFQPKPPYGSVITGVKSWNLILQQAQVADEGKELLKSFGEKHCLHVHAN